MPRFEHKFIVTGQSPFPVDMLRFDSCFPETAKDSAVIQSSLQNPEPENRSVRLVCVVHRKSWRPAADRWRARGWAVEDHMVILREGPLITDQSPPSPSPHPQKHQRPSQ